MKKLFVLLLVVLFLAACSKPTTKKEKGTWIGAGAGAAGGALLGQAIGGDTAGTLIGAGVGAIAGGAIGRHIGKKKDEEEAALRQELAATEAANVKRNADVLIVTFKSDYLFAVGSANLNPGAYEEINRVSRVLNQYPETTILVTGHTDSSGSEETNQELSERRSENVKNALVGQGVNPTRIRTVGFGESSPIADNSSEAGRQQNRRVVVTISPNPA